MDNVGDLFAQGIAFGEELSRLQENGDYLENGVLMCGKCGTPKSKILNLFGTQQLFPMMCKCEKEKAMQEERRVAMAKRYEEILELKKISLIDDKFRNATLDNTEQTKYNARQIKIARRYVEVFDQMVERNQGLLFYGEVGTGKSRLAACIANALIEKMRSVVSTSLVKLLQDSKYGRIDEKVLEALYDADLVLLDDLGAEKGTETAKEIIYYVVDSRSRSNKPMIVTSNLSLDAMKHDPDIKNRRVYDRVMEHCYPVEFKGPSYRMKEAMTRNDETRKILEGD